MNSSAMGPLTIAVALLVLALWLGLVHWIAKGIREDVPAGHPARLEDHLYRALLLATSTPSPYHTDGAQRWHGCDREANPVPREKCIGCIIQDALTAYELQRRAEREGDLQLLHGTYAEGF